ncbi:MAG: Ig-like domain-containing protein [Chitinispirillales bacterium]|nr:Ig-like domain-containing protein [Chitinispirillales bacterium]
MKNEARHFLLAGLTAFVCFFASCTIKDDNGDPVDPGTGVGPGNGSSAIQVLNVAPDSNYVAVGDTIRIRAQLFSDTTQDAPPLSRARIDVTASTGWLSARSITTDVNGWASVSFSNETEGVAELTFKYGNAQQSVLIEITDNPPRNISINASPSVLMADGSSKSIITVQVKNDFNNPIVGDTIRFATSAGLITASSVTDADGKAAAQLTSDRRNTVATITATLKSDAARNTKMNVEFSGVTITATAAPASIRPNRTDTCVVLATVLDAAGSPITGERVTFSKQLDSTVIVSGDSVTNARGEARLKIIKRPNPNGVTANTDTISITAAGASAAAIITFSNQHLTVEPNPVNQSFAAHPDSTTTFRVTYRDGSNAPISNATVEVSVTMGTMENDIIFARTLTTNSSGRASFTINNPSFTSVATVFVKAYDPTPGSNEFAIVSDIVYFQASEVSKLTISGTPSVISVNNGTGKITVTAFDEFNNRVKGAIISFNMLKGPGGGEYLAPATAATAADGTASTYLIAGTIPSAFKDVMIIASDFAGLRSDTVKFTIAGAPHAVSIERNMMEVTTYPAAYGLAVAAIVSDINGNPVADGIDVTFSAQIISRVCTEKHYKNADEWEWRINSYGYDIPESQKTALIISRIAQTAEGKGIANNELIYGQSAGWNYKVSILAEAQGIRSSPMEFLLRITDNAVEYWEPIWLYPKCFD